LIRSWNFHIYLHLIFSEKHYAVQKPFSQNRQRSIVSYFAYHCSNASYHRLDDTNIDFFQLPLDSTVKFCLIFCFLTFCINCTSQQSSKVYNGSGLRHIWGVISFGHYFVVFLLQSRTKDCFVIFVVLFDEFDHFGLTFGDINVSIDSLTLEPPPSMASFKSDLLVTKENHKADSDFKSFLFVPVYCIVNRICWLSNLVRFKKKS
jgi:hypothetical protein